MLRFRFLLCKTREKQSERQTMYKKHTQNKYRQAIKTYNTYIFSQKYMQCALLVIQLLLLNVRLASWYPMICNYQEGTSSVFLTAYILHAHFKSIRFKHSMCHESLLTSFIHTCTYISYAYTDTHMHTCTHI